MCVWYKDSQKNQFISYENAKKYVGASITARVQTTFFGLTMIQNIRPACKIPIAKPFMWVGLQAPVYAVSKTEID